MKLFKETTWKWWELKLTGLYGLALGAFLATWLAEWVAEYKWYMLGVAVAAGIYTVVAYLRK